MANISNLKINERSNIERPNLRVTTIENENWEDKPLIFEMVQLNFFIFQITKFYKLINYLENWLIF